MHPRASILAIAACLLLLHSMTCPAPSQAAGAATTIKLDGKSLYIPEIELTRKVNPVTSFLYIGSWETRAGAGNVQQSLCSIDPKNKTIHIKSPERLLQNSRPKVGTPNRINAYLDGISWGRWQASHIAFRIVSGKRQPAIIEINTDHDVALFHNEKSVGTVRADMARISGGRGLFPITLEPGDDNIITIKQFSFRSKPRFNLSVSLDRSHELTAAWQERVGLLKKLVHMPAQRVGNSVADIPALAWSRNLGNFSPSLEVRDVATNKIVIQRESTRQGPVLSDENQDLAPGVYEAIYRNATESASELFMVGNPHDLFARLQDALSKHTPDPASKLNIEVLLRRARILLSKDNCHIYDRTWQEKALYVFNSLTTMERRLREGAVNISKDLPGLHIRGFKSGSDGSNQFYRLYIPSTYNRESPLPLLVLPSARVRNRQRPYIEGPVIANQREALLWAKYAEKHGFALLWPGYRSIPEGYSYESVHINAAIKAVEDTYAIDKHRISVYATCGAGYNAGRLVTEYNNRFSSIVYDLAVFEFSLDGIKETSQMEWYGTVNPSRHVIDNKNLKIFVMHDDTKPPGHGPMSLSTEFLDLAKTARNDVVSHLTDLPMTVAARMDMIFSWLAASRNENPDGKRSYFPAKAGYAGPIMEIFATPLIVVEGTRAQGAELEAIQIAMESLRLNYMKHFHNAECVVKKDTEITQADIDNNSLILIGNPQSNSVWEKLQPHIPVKMTSTEVLYKNDKLAGNRPFQAIVRHPNADGKYVLMLGAGDLKTLGRVPTSNLFTAWYDSLTVSPRMTIGKLDSLRDARVNVPKAQDGAGTPKPPKAKARGTKKNATKSKPAK